MPLLGNSHYHRSLVLVAGLLLPLSHPCILLPLLDLLVALSFLLHGLSRPDKLAVPVLKLLLHPRCPLLPMNALPLLQDGLRPLNSFLGHV